MTETVFAVDVPDVIGLSIFAKDSNRRFYKKLIKSRGLTKELADNILMILIEHGRNNVPLRRIVEQHKEVGTLFEEVRTAVYVDVRESPGVAGLQCKIFESKSFVEVEFILGGGIYVVAIV